MDNISRVDLHTHSVFSSDGQYPPSHLVTLADELGLAAVALTDHDEVGGLDEFVAAGRDRKVQAIPGVELTCDLGERWVHILGYFIDSRAPSIKDVITRGREARRTQAEGRLAKLKALGITVDREKLDAAARGQPPVGPIIGMVALGDAANDGHALLEPLRQPPKNALPFFHFDRDMLSHGTPAYYPVRRISPGEAIAAIRAAGGAAVFAHPGDRFDVTRDRGVFERLAKEGLAGMECYSSYHTPAQEEVFAAFARELNLVVTAGSDYHGPRVKPHVQLGGVNAGSYEMVTALLDRLPGPAAV